MRLIDADALPRNVWLDGNVLVIAVDEVDNAPTIDPKDMLLQAQDAMEQKQTEKQANPFGNLKPAEIPTRLHTFSYRGCEKRKRYRKQKGE